MHFKRLGVGVAVVNRLLYAVGGFDGNERLASMECYHPENNAWTLLPTMQTGRSGAGVAALNLYIYVVGGFDGRVQLSSVERYDTEQQIWESVASIRIARSALSLTVLDGKLYAMGGFDGHSFLSIVEVYNPANDRWEEGTPLTSGRSGHASAVIYQPSCASVYMDCIGEPIDKKKPQPDDDDITRNDPSTSKSGAPPSTSTNALHPFSGNRCNHCDDSQQSDLSDGDGQRMAHMEHLMNHGPNKSMSADDQSKYEQQCRRAVYSLLQMDSKEQLVKEEKLRYSKNSTSSSKSDGATSTSSDVSMELHDDAATRSNGNDAFVENRKQYRRRKSKSDRSEDDTDVFDSDSNSNSRDSISSNSNQVVQKNRQNPKKKHCSLSKLTNTFRQNINDFVAWSSSSTPPPLASTSSVPDSKNLKKSGSNRGDSDERKCSLVKKYYKCKLKP